MTEVVKKEEYTLIPENDFDFLIWFDEQKKRAEVIYDKIKHDGRKFLEDNNLQECGYTQSKDGATIHLYETKPYKKKQVDINKMKDEGVYDLYTRDVWVKGSIRVQIEYDD